MGLATWESLGTGEVGCRQRRVVNGAVGCFYVALVSHRFRLAFDHRRGGQFPIARISFFALSAVGAGRFDEEPSNP